MVKENDSVRRCGTRLFITYSHPATVIRYVLYSFMSYLAKLDYVPLQIDLVVGDYFKCTAAFLTYTDRASDLITWLRSKTYVLAQLRHIQQTVTRIDKSPLTVIRPVFTRWTAHYLAY